MNMRAIRLSLLCAAAVSAMAPAVHAARQTAVGPGPVPLNATGVLGGVDMSGSGITGTLTVGTVGGPQMDIFTQNNPAVAGLVAVSTAASSQGNIAFNSSSNVYGAIGQTQPAGPFLLAITGGNNATAVNFMGPVFATTIDDVGSGSLNFNSGSTNIAASNFAADGTINLAPNTTLIGALTTTAGAQTGTLILGGGSVLNGAVGGAIGLRSINVTGGSNQAGVTATISGAVDAYAFALGTNTLNIGGALTIANGGPGGVINTTLASPSVYGNIRPVGATNLGSTLLINVTVPATAFIPVGTQFNVVQTQAGTVQSGTDGSVVAVTVQNPTNPLYTFRALPAAGTVAGLVTIQTTGIPLQVAVTPPAGAVVPPTLPIAAAVAPVLLAVAPTTDLATVLAAVNAMSTPAAVVNAVVQLAPSTSDAAAAQVTFAGTRQLQNIWMARFAETACDQVRPRKESAGRDAPMCSRPERRGGFWVQGFGNFARQHDQQAIVGYDADTGGVMAAWDAPVGPDTSAGFGFGYANASIRANSGIARTHVDTYQVTAYVNHDPGPWFLNAAVSLGANSYSGDRDIVFPGVNRRATASYGGTTVTGVATTGWHIPMGSAVVTPLAGIQYSRIKIGGYTEAGAADIDLRLQARKYDFVESTLGVKLARPYQTAHGAFVPEIHGKWLRELGNPKQGQTAAFVVPGSQSFDVPGLRTADNLWNAGAGFILASCGCTSRAWSIEAGYDYYGSGAGYSAHQGTVRLSARF
jgi:outer membrane autotransporter protein